jgi:hypothetical protein
MPFWTMDLPDELQKYPYTPTVPPDQCQHLGSWRVIRCDSETDIIRCDQCGSRAKVTCNFDDDFA